MEQKIYHYAEIRLPRRKKVWQAFHSNTFRIFDETLPERLDPLSVYQNPHRPSGDVKESESRNVPHPHDASFIRTNVRFLNQPVTHMEDRHTDAEQLHWWSNSLEAEPRVKAPYSKSSTQRSDFQPIRDAPGRERLNNRRSAAGIVPALSFLEQPEKPLNDC